MNRPTPPSRLAIVLSHPTQYYSPWFRWLSQQTPLTIRVFYLWDFGVERRHDPQFQADIRWDVDLLSGYESERVPNVSRDPGTHHFWGLRNPELTRRLAAWRPEALLLFGYNWASPLRVILWARRRGIPLLFRGDSHFLGRGQPSGIRAWLLRLLFRQFAAVTTVGAANRAYFASLGVSSSRLFFAPHAVDHSLFDPARTEHRAATATLRAQLGLGEFTRVVLFAGKLVPAKQPAELLQAFVSLAPADTALVFVGEGPEKEGLRAMAASLAPGASIHFLPFANQTEMPARYLLADLFVLPSRGHYETWGLAVNEAMLMGVPCLVSDVVGCQQDLITPGKTGWVFRAGDSRALAQSLGTALTALADPAARASIARAVAERISGYTYAQTTDGLLAALASLSCA